MRKESSPNRCVSKVKSDISNEGASKVYTLDVFIIEGPITKEFEEKEVSRTIQIKGNQTLQNLHQIIYTAFDRWDEHLYEFNLGKGPSDRSVLYSLPTNTENEGNDEVGDVSKTTIESLELTIDRSFGYWFDFGDDWLHQINVVAIDEKTGSGKYPKIVKRVGDSPPQYPDFDEELDVEGS